MLESISKYRSAIMGLATIWVMLFHWCENFTYAPPLEPLARCGYGGVDIFLLLSGFGLFVGYDKYKSVWPFYLKRFLRLYPTYLVVVIISFVLKHDYSVSNILLASLGVGFYLPFKDLPWYEWYVPTIFVFYLLFPFIYRFLNKNIKYILILLLFSFLMIGLLVYFQKGSYQILAISRIPVFLVGVYLGWQYKKQREKETQLGSIAYSLFIICLFLFFIELDVVSFYDYTILWKYAIFWVPFVIIAPGFTFAAGKGFVHVPRLGICFSKLGEVSLEMYLLHMLLLDFTRDYLKLILSNDLWMNYLFFILLVLVVYFISVILNKLLKRISNGLLRIAPGS